jgi:hypothetical protein
MGGAFKQTGNFSTLVMKIGMKNGLYRSKSGSIPTDAKEQ